MVLQKAENEAKVMLMDTVLSFCENIPCQYKICVEGLLGFTVDDKEVILVHINQTVSKQATLSSAKRQRQSTGLYSDECDSDFSETGRKRRKLNCNSLQESQRTIKGTNDALLDSLQESQRTAKGACDALLDNLQESPRTATGANDSLLDGLQESQRTAKGACDALLDMNVEAASDDEMTDTVNHDVSAEQNDCVKHVGDHAEQSDKDTSHLEMSEILAASIKKEIADEDEWVKAEPTYSNSKASVLDISLFSTSDPGHSMDESAQPGTSAKVSIIQSYR